MKRYVCWFDDCDEETSLIEAHSARHAAERYCARCADSAYDEDAFIVHVRDGDTVRRFEVVARVETTFVADEVKP